MPEFRDPADFPGRPEHEDFWEIVKTVLDNDGAMDAGADFETYVSRFVDPESLHYIALQRAMRVVTPANRGELQVLTKAAATWVDGFLAGVQFKRNAVDAGN